MAKRIVALALLAATVVWAVPANERASQARGPVGELAQQIRAAAKERSDGGQDGFKVLVAAAEYGIENLASMLQDSSGGDFTCEYLYAHQYYLRRPDSLLAAGVAAIVTFTDYQYLNKDMFGDTLAKFIDLGGGVVITVFADYAPWNIGGRFATQYMPVAFANNTYTSGTLGTVHQPTHPIMNGVTTVGCGNYKTGTTSITHAPWTTRIADWVGGQVEAAAFDSGGRRVAWLGFFGYGNWIGGLSGQWCRQMVNAIRWVSVMHDVGCSRFEAPSGLVDSGQTVTPACSVYNYGNQTAASYWVKMRISPSYEESVQVTSHVPGTARYVTFPTWTAVSRGNYTARCSTMYSQDNNPNNNYKSANGFVRVRDCGVRSLSAPQGLYSRMAIVTPAATWRNWGNVSAGFEAWMKLYDPSDAEVYARKVDIPSLLPGADIFVTAFPNCTLVTGGTWFARCSTYYDGDQVSLNDVLVDSFQVSIGNPDIGVMSIVAPTGRVDTGAVVTPQGRVKNFGDVVVPFRAWFVMRDSSGVEQYREYIDVTGLAVGRETTLTFPGYSVGTNEGTWATRCSVSTAGDVQSNNDFRSGTFTVSARPPWPVGWSEVTSMPSGTKAVKDGGWLAISGDGGLIYAARGNKSGDFFSFRAADSSWTALTAIPNGAEAKPPYRGAAGVCDNSGHVYATKGNNTLGFWRYGDGTWTQLPDVPLGPSGTRVKGGTDLVYVVENETGYVYLLKGYKTDFFRFNTVTGVWDTTLPSAPAGAQPKWDKGSWCELSPQPDPPGRIFAHKAKFHELWTFDLTTHTWASTPLSGMPLVGMMGKSKKSKDGGCAAYYNGALYALKGGNTQEFWKYTIATGSWRELDTMPSVGTSGKKKRVKAGADIVSYGGGVFFALKGNKTNELWRYVEAAVAEPAASLRSTVQTQSGDRSIARFTLEPNPAGRSFVSLSYPLEIGPATVRVYDVSGRTVVTAAVSGGRTTLDLRSLSPGVYLVKLEAPGWSTAQKLVLQ